LGANFGKTEKQRISVSAEKRPEKLLAAFFFLYMKYKDRPKTKNGRNRKTAEISEKQSEKCVSVRKSHPSIDIIEAQPGA